MCEQIRTTRNDHQYSGAKSIHDRIANGSSSTSCARRYAVGKRWNRIDHALRIRCATWSLSKKVSSSYLSCRQLLRAVAMTDHTVKDVTKRYAQKYSTVTTKARVPSKHGSDWFAELLEPFSRSFHLVSLFPHRLSNRADTVTQNRDHAEDAELEEYGLNESMPTSVIGFKDHPKSVALSLILLPDPR